MNTPKIDGAPGLRWRKRKRTWVAVWVARDDLVKRDYPNKTSRLWEGVIPTEVEVKFIRSECTRLQDEMLTWGRGLVRDHTKFDGTMRGLIRCYQHDPDSRYQNLRYGTRKTYDKSMELIENTVGTAPILALKATDFDRWYEGWAKPAQPGGLRRVDRAHYAISMVRQLLSFGLIREFDGAERLATILSHMEFENGWARTQELTREHAVAICAEANRIGRHSIALGQALQFETGMRQKDVVGEWLPMGEPGMSDVTYHGMKWMFGLDWHEITESTAGLVVGHRLSKSLKGRSKVLEARAGKIMTVHVRLCPMITAELARVPAEARVGPLIKDEMHGRPFANWRYAKVWRDIARAVGVPDDVQNRDTRAGAITEAIEVSGSVEAAQQFAGHSKKETTQRYNRGGDRQTAKILELRSKLHGK